MCCSVRVPAIVTCAACRRSQTVPEWQAAGAWERARPEPGAALWRRLLDAVREPAACCSEACAARGGAGAVSRPARVSLAAAGQPADRATEQPAGPESGRRAAPRPSWLPLVAGMGLVLAACSPSPAAGGPARPAEQVAAPTLAPTAPAPSATEAPRVVPPTPSPAAATSTPVAAQTAAQATKPAGPPAPDFAVQTLDGKPFSLADKRGKTVVVLFTASGCGECIPELQALARVHKAYGPRGVEILALSVDPFDTADALGAMKQAAGPGADYAWALDAGNKVARAYDVKALETTVIVDPTGRIVYRDEVSTTDAVFQRELAKILG